MKVKKQPRVVVVKVKEKILTDVEKQRNKYSLRSKRMFDQPKEREASKRATVKSSSNVRQNRSNLISTEEKKTATCSEKCDSSTVEKQENKYSLRSKRNLDPIAERTTKSTTQKPTFKRCDNQSKVLSENIEKSAVSPADYNINQTEKYSLRARPIVDKPKPAPRIVSNAVSEIGLSTRKQQIWSKCKKLADKSKLLEGNLVFAKQVCMTSI